MTQPHSPRSAKSASGPAAGPAAGSKLSIAQMLGLMRVEFHRARAQRQPLCCMMVAVDGLADMQKRGGFALKQAAMRTAYENLKTVARERQCFGMSLLSGDRIMAIFPGTSPQRLAEFGNALVEYSRAHPITFKGLYREDAPAKVKAPETPAAGPAAPATPAAPAAQEPAAPEATPSESTEKAVEPSATADAEEIQFADAPGERLSSRESLLVEVKAPEARVEEPKLEQAKIEEPKSAEPAPAEPEAEAPKAAEPKAAESKPAEPKAEKTSVFNEPGTAVQVPLTLSLGASHNLLAETSSSFEGLVEKAGRALSTAREANGNRYVMWREAEAEIAGLRDDLAAQRASFRQEEAVLAEEASEVGGLQQAALVDRIQAIFAKVTRTPDIETVEREIIALAVEELYEGRKKAVEAQMAEHKRLVDQLERRVAKLTSLLGVTEEQLQRVLSMKTIDEGVASIYRTVQGLAAETAQAEQKRAMMSVIFKENLSFQKRDAPSAEPAKAA
jgi:GGDEF domain-containing protein